MTETPPAADAARVTVVVPAYNAERVLPACLDALLAQDFPRKDYEVIVVDDGSADGTAAAAARDGVVCITQPNRGPAAARNRGAAAGRGEFLLFTDADCVPAPDWIAEMLRPFEDPGIAAAKGAYSTRQRSLAARFAQQEFMDRYDLLLRAEAVDMIDTYSAAYRRAIFEALGGFDESFPAPNGEDMDLSCRLAEAGHRMAFAPRAVVCHTHPATLARYLRIKFTRAYWRMLVYRRFPGKVVKDSYTPLALKLETALMTLSWPCLLCLPMLRAAAVPLALLWGGVLALSLPFSRQAFRRDPAVGLAAPFVVFLRSAVFSAGSLLGLLMTARMRPAAGGRVRA